MNHMVPTATNESIRKSMKGNVRRDTKPELILRSALWRRGLKGYRVDVAKVAGRPDIAFISKMVAVFVNGCFWHRCPRCKTGYPKSNQSYWIPKLDTNVARDRRNQTTLRHGGWQVIVVWECEIIGRRANIEGVLERISNAVSRQY